MTRFSFEDKIDVINYALHKKRGKWQLKARTDFDWEDVEQIIRIHIHKKWGQWNQSRPLEPWINRIISRQIINLLRNLYGSYSRPCLNCAANQGGNLCAIYKSQCEECPLYAKWVKGKKRAYDVKMPLSMENHVNEVEGSAVDSVDYESATKVLHKKMKERLSAPFYEIYELIYIFHKTDDEIATIKRYKKTHDPKRKSHRYKQLENYRKKFVETAKQIIKEGEVF